MPSRRLLGATRATGGGGGPSPEPPVGPQTVLDTTFTVGDFSEFRSCQWSGRNDNCLGYDGTSDYSASVVSIDGRAHVARFEVRDGDVPPFGGSERAEISEVPGAGIFLGDEVWCGMDIKFPADFPTPVVDWHTIWQLHGPSGTAAPPLTLDVGSDDILYLTNDEPTSELDRTAVGPIVRGQWVRYLVHFKAAVSSVEGWGEVYQDGVLVLAQHPRATVLDDGEHYLKWGIYRDSAHTATSVVYFDQLRLTINRPVPGQDEAPAYKSHTATSVAQSEAAVSVAAPVRSSDSALPAETDYQCVMLLLSSSSIDVPATAPSGWVELENFIVDSPVTGASGSSRFVLYELTPTATLTEKQAAFALTLTGARLWAAIRGCYTLPAGSAGRTVPIATKAEATGTASTTHTLPAVTTITPSSLVIGLGGSDQWHEVGMSQSWPSTGLMTQRVNYTGLNTQEIVSVAMADQVISSPQAGISGTFTTQTADECGLFTIVLDSAAFNSPVYQSITSTGASTNGGSGLSATVPAPTGLVTGDVVLVFAYVEEATADPTLSGFTRLSPMAVATGNHVLATFWHVVTDPGTEPTDYTVSWGTDQWWELTAVRVSGVDTTTPIESYDQAAAGSGTVTPAVSVTTAGDSRLLVWAGSNYNNYEAAHTWTAPSGWEGRDTARIIGVATLEQPSATVVDGISGAATQDGPCTGVAFALRPAAG